MPFVCQWAMTLLLMLVSGCLSEEPAAATALHHTDVGGASGSASASTRTRTAPRRLSVHLYGAPNANVTEANASFFASVGVTDAWVPYLQGAFPVDCCHNDDAAYKAGGLYAGLVTLQQVPHTEAHHRHTLICSDEQVTTPPRPQPPPSPLPH